MSGEATGAALRADVIDGRRLAEELRAGLRAEADGLTSRPGLATVLVGDNYASLAYARRVERLAADLDCAYADERLGSDAEQADVLASIGKLNADPRISGILVLRPLPAHIREVEVFRLLDPLKDIEAVHPDNTGRLANGHPRFVPSTPAACFLLIDRYLESTGRDPGTFYDGRKLVLVGRSQNVGKPALLLGLQRNATVVSCHRMTSETGTLVDFTSEADILIVAAGVPDLITGDMVKPGAIVIDVGINPVTGPDGAVHLVGDADFESVARVAEAISPVPGGVGPVTDALLLRNTFRAAELAAAERHRLARAGG
jgi:methylenetetrahydrofolate dehydrogenase (NADP+)/methenyltetrahydrofolate cyclohydrolase